MTVKVDKNSILGKIARVHKIAEDLKVAVSELKAEVLAEECGNQDFQAPESEIINR